MREPYQIFLQEFADALVHHDHFCIVIHRFMQLFKETNSVDCKKDSARPTIRNGENVEAVSRFTAESWFYLSGSVN